MIVHSGWRGHLGGGTVVYSGGGGGAFTWGGGEGGVALYPFVPFLLCAFPCALLLPTIALFMSLSRPSSL